MSTTDHILPRQAAIQHLYKLTQKQALMVDVLLEKKVLTWQEMVTLELAPSMKAARVLIAKARKILEKFDVTINNGYGTGYFIEPADREKILKRIDRYRSG